MPTPFARGTGIIFGTDNVKWGTQMKDDFPWPSEEGRQEASSVAKKQGKTSYTLGQEKTEYVTEQQEKFRPPAEVEAYIPVARPPLRTTVCLGSDATTYSTTNFMPHPADAPAGGAGGGGSGGASSADFSTSPAATARRVSGSARPAVSAAAAAALSATAPPSSSAFSLSGSGGGGGGASPLASSPGRLLARSPATSALVETLATSGKHVSSISFGHDKKAAAAPAAISSAPSPGVVPTALRGGGGGSPRGGGAKGTV